MNSHALGPFGYGHCFPFERKSHISALVVGLFFVGSPLAIVLSIWAIIIKPLYREARRALTHIREEIVEIIPTFVELYVPSAVMMESWVFWVATTLNNIAPNPVRARFGHPMPERALIYATARTLANPQLSGDHANDHSARATAFPFSWVFRVFWNAPYSFKFTKAIARRNGSMFHRVTV